MTRFLAACFLVLALVGGAAAATPTMTVAPPVLIKTSYDVGTSSDLSCPSMRNPAKPDEILTWTSNGQYAFAKYSGPLSNPQQTLLWQGYAGRWDFTGFPTGYRPWLGNIYKHSDGTLIGFVHVETEKWDLPTCQYRQGIAISTDNGDHWKYCGDVIKSQVEAEGQQNLGGCAVIIVGEYFYQYFNEYETNFYRKPAVARAKITEVVAAAKNHTVSPWVKYHNGSWNHDALTEAGSSIVPYPADRHDAHGDAVWCAPLGRYLMVVYEQTGWNYLTFQKSDALKGIYMYTSTDGVNWTDKRHVFTPQPGGDGCYPYFAGLDGASDDNLSVGSAFYLYVHDRARHELYRIPITISGGASQVATPAFNVPAGTYAAAQTVTITSATAGAAIRYTLDGSTPTASTGLVYGGPVAITASATLRAIASKSGMTDSSLASAAYTIQAAAAGGLRVVQLGDSNTEIGYISKGLRGAVITDFGDHGTGYHPLNGGKTGASYGTTPAGFTVVNDASWQLLDMYHNARRTPPHLAPDGNWIESSVVNAATTVTFTGTGIDIYWLGKSGGGTFSVTIDGVASATVSTANAGYATKRTAIAGLANANHTVILKVVSGSVALLGIDAKKGTPAQRSIVHKFGNGFAASKDFLDIDAGVFGSALQLLAPTHVCIVLGTNDHNLDNRSAAAFKSNLLALITRVQAAVPGAQVLVVSTFATNTAQASSLLPQYLATSYPQAAFERGVGYWNMSGWFGPYNAARMLDDWHCNQASGASIGQELYRQLLLSGGQPSPVAIPVFSLPAGTYPSAQSVTITSATPGATIRYTTDGSTPTATTGQVYAGPVAIPLSTTLKAIAAKSGLTTSAVVSAAYTIQATAQPGNVLRRHPTNPRYFTDDSGKAIYLTGAHTWATLQDGWLTSGRNADPAPAFDFAGYLDHLQSQNHNFIRLWMQELPKVDFTAENGGVYYPSPNPWMRNGAGTANDGKPKFNLAQFNQAYFDRLRSRVQAAGARGMYVSIMLFEGYGMRLKNGNLGWNYSPFHASNNINGINGDPNGNGNGNEAHSLQIPAITALQEAYVRKVVDTVNDLDNVLYEISNEEGNILGGTTARDWQYHLMNHLRTYEAAKGKVHPVGLSCIYNQDNTTANNAWLTASSADWIAPWGPPGSAAPLHDNPAATTGSTVVFADSDHIFGVGGGADWVWKTFMRGYNVVFMDGWVNNGWTWTPPANYDRVAASGAMGDTRSYATRMDLAAMTPQGALASTGYCLAKTGTAYLIYQPGSGAFTATLTAGTYACEWFNPGTGSVAASGQITAAGGAHTLTPPFSGPAVAYLTYLAAGAVGSPAITPFGGTHTGSATVSLSTATAGASIRYTTNGSTPSDTVGTLYAGAFTLTASATVKAIAFKAGMTSSPVVSAAFTINPAGLTPPTILTPAAGTVFTAATTSVTVSWGAVAGAATYLVRCSDLTGTTPNDARNSVNGSHFLYLDRFAPTTVTFTVVPGHSYRFWVHAAAANLSFSNPASYSAESVLLFSVASQTAADPVISPAGGTTSGPVSVTLTTTTAGAGIRYTTDGSTPSATVGTLYTGAFTLNASATVKAIAYKTGLTSSAVVSAVFTVNPGGLATPVITAPAAASVFPGTATTVTVSWNPVPGAASYLVRCSDLSGTTDLDPRNTYDGGSFLYIDEWTQTSITIDVLPGHAYHFWVHAAAANFSYGLPASYSVEGMVDFSVGEVDPDGSQLPSAWSAGSIGNAAIAGSASLSEDTWTVSGSGADIWGTADGFHFAALPFTGDGEITARVVSQTGSNPWAKAGVMIRESLLPGSRHAFLAVTTANGVAFQRRLQADAASSHTAGATNGAPYWVRLSRVGNVITASQSADGATWRVVGTATLAIGADAHIGLAVTSHDNAALSTAVFDHVVVTVAPQGNG